MAIIVAERRFSGEKYARFSLLRNFFSSHLQRLRKAVAISHRAPQIQLPRAAIKYPLHRMCTRTRGIAFVCVWCADRIGRAQVCFLLFSIIHIITFGVLVRFAFKFQYVYLFFSPCPFLLCSLFFGKIYTTDFSCILPFFYAFAFHLNSLRFVLHFCRFGSFQSIEI